MDGQKRPVKAVFILEMGRWKVCSRDSLLPREQAGERSEGGREAGLWVSRENTGASGGRVAGQPGAARKVSL